MAQAAQAASGNVQRQRYRVAELAALLELDPSTVYRMIYSGRLHAERHGSRGGAIRIPAEAVATYLASTAASEAAVAS